MANTQIQFHPDQSSLITYLQHPQPNNFVLQPSFNTNYMQQQMQNPKDISNPTTALDMALVLMAKEFTLNDTTPINNNQRSSSNSSNIAECQEPGCSKCSSESGSRAEGNGVYDKIEEVTMNCTLKDNLHQASTSGTQTNSAPVYDSDRSAKYTELLEPIPEPHQVQQNDSNVTSAVSSVEQSRGTAEQITATIEETRAYFESLYNNLAIEVEKVNTVNHKMKETNVDLTIELARYKNQEKCFEINQEKYDNLKGPNLFETSNLLQKKADESVAKHKTLEFEIERLLRVFVKKDIMSIVQSNSVVDTSNLQIELDRMKEKLKNCIIKKEKEYVVLWNSWYTKGEECKYDKISYDKAYNDMQQKIKRLQAQLGDQKGKSKDTPCVSDTLDSLSQKLENENVSEQKDTTKGTSTNTKFANQSTERKPSLQSLRNNFVVRQPNAFQSERPKFSKTRVPPKVVESNDLSNPVTSNSAPSSRESTVVNNERVIAPGIFRINPFKASRVDNLVPKKHAKASVRIKLVTVSQPHVITKKDVNSNTNGLSPKNIEITTRTRRPQPRNNPKNDKVPSRSKSSCLSHNLEKIEENHRSLQSSNYPDHTSSECNNIKLAIRNKKSEYVNGMKSRKKNQSANVLKSANQKKHKANVKKSKKLGSKERLASSRPSKPRTCLKWLPTGRIFGLSRTITESSNTKIKFDTFMFDTASASNPQEPTNKGFPSSASFHGRFSKLRRKNSCIYPLDVL
ncbi:hypothetical protein Tco_1304764 [Tanacetum coccineum]